MQLRVSLSRNQWDSFVQEYADDGGVLQSWEWGELEEKEGYKFWQLAWENGGALVACCLLVERSLSFGWKYLYAPRGPVVRIMNYELGIRNVLDEVEKFAREQGAVFLRVEPPYRHESGIMNQESWKEVTPVQPKQTLCIDLTKSEDELLKSMHQKTRYNIGLAEKRGVRVEDFKFQILNFKFDIFWKLLSETAKRDGFHLHSKQHYTLLATHYPLFIAHFRDKPLAAALVAFFGKTAYYLHGASANEHRDVMAPYALHWHIMREAKRRGCTTYDLWGVDEKRWPGVTRFKQGFAPATPFTTYAGTYDIPIRKIPYTLYRVKKFLWMNNFFRKQ